VGALKEALLLCLRQLPHGWVFRFNKELQHWLPYVVEGVNEETGGRYSTPHVRLTLIAWRLGQRKEVTVDLYSRNTPGRERRRWLRLWIGSSDTASPSKSPKRC
jgi:hypothetical protein